MKVTTIEEDQDLSKIKNDELIGSLQTFEMDISGRSEKKKKSVDFVSNIDKDEDQSEKDIKENFSDVTALIDRKFNNALKDLDRKQMINVLDKVCEISQQSKNRDEDKPNRGKET